LYIDTLQQVDCDIMYIQQSIPQITIHLYIDTLQQVDCDIMYIQPLDCDVIYIQEYITNHNPLVVYRHLTTGGL
jgi:hypothetical protein